MKRKILPELMSRLRLTAFGFFIQCLCIYGAYAQGAEQIISGTVTDVEGNGPLPGVSVLIKGTTTGTATDAEGKYQIKASRGQVLTFSFVGYQSSEITVGEATTYSVSLKSDTKELGEVVVTGYTTQSKRTISGAVSSVSGKDLPTVSQTSIDRAIQGKVPGVMISSEGVPGGNTMVRIRGFGTANSNDPLFVIDGVPTKGVSLSSLSASDIESITVLKDASAASIYGSRAGNGVIVITTKRGSAKSAGLNVTINRGIQSVNSNRFPTMLTPQQLADATRIRQINGGATSFTHPAYGNDISQSTLPDFINPIGFQNGNDIIGYNGQVVAHVNQYDANDKDGDGVYQLMRANKKGTNWFDEVFDPAKFTNVTMNYNGGSDKGNFYVGAEYFGQDGVAKYTNFNRYSARINSTGFIKEWLRLGQSMNVNYTEGVGLQNQYENGILANTYRIPSIIPVYDEGGNFAGNQQNSLGDARNPVAELYRGRFNKTRTLRTFGNAYVEVNPIKDLTAKSLVGVDYQTINGTYYNAINPGDYQTAINNSFNETNLLNSTLIFTNTLNYNKDIGNHKINVLLGSEYINGVFRQSNGNRLDYISDNNTDIRYLSSGTGAMTTTGSGAKNALFSYFGKVDYSLKDKYFANFTLRRDQTSRFPVSGRNAIFPAASVGWMLSDESFMQALTPVNSFKLRAGWGQTGNQDIPDSNAANTFFTSDLNYSSYALDGSNTAVTPGYDKIKRGNPLVKWETTETLNVGFDAQLFHALDVTFEWYDRETKDMLIQVKQPATAGAANDAFLNVGAVQNKGMELALNYTSNRAKTIRYSVGVNFSTYRNLVKEINSAPIFGARAFDLQFMTITKAGAPLSSFYGFIVDGVFKDQAEVDAYAQKVQQDGARPGTFKFRDVDGDGQITDLDRTIIGNPHPDFMYGINLNIGYKNFDLTLTGTGVQGNDIFNATKYFTDFWNFSGNKSTRILNAWTESNTNTNIPQLNSNLIPRESQESTYYIEDGSFFRIRNVQLNYNFPRTILGKALTAAKVYVSAQNIVTITKYSGLDPEINLRNFNDPNANKSLGVDLGAYPMPRVVSLGLQATF